MLPNCNVQSVQANYARLSGSPKIQVESMFKEVVVSTHLKNMLVKIDHPPNGFVACSGISSVDQVLLGICSKNAQKHTRHVGT